MSKKLNLKKLEEKLGKSLRRNSIVIAFDSSEHATGVSILKTTDKSLIIEKTIKLDVHKDIKRLNAVDIFTEQLDNFRNSLLGKYKFDDSIIENVYVGFNPQVALYLARVGILAYDRFKRLSDRAYLRLPTTARKILGFKKSGKKIKGKKLKKELMDFIGNLLEIKIEDNDIGDSLILALSGLVKND